MALKISNSQWISIVLITAVLMLVFLVFGNKVPHTQPTPQPQSQEVKTGNAPEKGA